MGRRPHALLPEPRLISVGADERHPARYTRTRLAFRKPGGEAARRKIWNISSRFPRGSPWFPLSSPPLHHQLLHLLLPTPPLQWSETPPPSPAPAPSRRRRPSTRSWAWPTPSSTRTPGCVPGSFPLPPQTSTSADSRPWAGQGELSRKRAAPASGTVGRDGKEAVTRHALG